LDHTSPILGFWSPKAPTPFNILLLQSSSIFYQTTKKVCLHYRVEAKSVLLDEFGISLFSISCLEMTFTGAIGHWKTTSPWAASAIDSSFPFTSTLQAFFLSI
jgi:hypothetical protein